MEIIVDRSIRMFLNKIDIIITDIIEDDEDENIGRYMINYLNKNRIIDEFRKILKNMIIPEVILKRRFISIKDNIISMGLNVFDMNHLLNKFLIIIDDLININIEYETYEICNNLGYIKEHIIIWEEEYK